MARGARRRHRRRRARAGRAAARAASVGEAHRRGAAIETQRADPVRQHDPAGGRARAPGRPRARAPGPLADPLERDRDGPAGQRRVLGARRPHRHLPVGGACSTRSASTTSGTRPRDEHGGDLVYIQGHSLARASTPARSSRAGSARSRCDGFRQEVSRERRAQLLPAPVADAGLLAVPDRLDGPGADHGDLPGPLHALPRRPRHRRHRAAARSGPSSATARPTSPSRWARSRSPAASASTTSSSSSTATCSASTARCAATARSSRSSRRSSAAPAGT